MGRRSRDDLDDLLEAWARWCVSGSLVSAPASLLARWMDAKGHITFGGGGGAVEAVSLSAFPIEERVEVQVSRLALRDLLAADVLRLEYNAGYREVVRRRRLRGYDHRNLTQAQKAHHLGVSVRTYRYRLANARQAVAQGFENSLKEELTK